jgi:hypothetical protein
MPNRCSMAMLLFVWQIPCHRQLLQKFEVVLDKEQLVL